MDEKLSGSRLKLWSELSDPDGVFSRLPFNCLTRFGNIDPSMRSVSLNPLNFSD